MWSSEEIWLSIGSVLTAVIAIWLSRILCAHLKAKRAHSLNHKNSELRIPPMHRWSFIDSNLKNYWCGCCSNVIVENETMECEYCGLCTHEECLQKAQSSPQFICKSSVCEEIEVSMGHHWIKVGIVFDEFENWKGLESGVCLVCDKDFGQDSKALQCCWCLRAHHLKCQADKHIPQICDMGLFRQYVVPAHCIKLDENHTSIAKVEFQPLPDWIPVIFVFNSGSGSAADVNYVVNFFRRILNPIQVVNIGSMNHSFLLDLATFLKAHCVFLVAGGDGTVSWLLDILQKNPISKDCDDGPGIGIIPLGTGNDLARVLCWGSEYSADKMHLKTYLDHLLHAEPVLLDRWRLTLKPFGKLSSLPLRRKEHTRMFQNYFSIGVDAKVALDFHQTRKTSPLYVPSRLYNKLLYTVFTTKQAMAPDCSALQEKVQLFLDGTSVSILATIESIVLLNIPSWAAGVDLWKLGANENEDEMEMQRMDDGKLEVLAIYSPFHIAQLQMGLSEPYRIGQASHVKIKLLKRMAVQMDGEPWIESKSTEIEVTCSGKAKMLKVT